MNVYISPEEIEQVKKRKRNKIGTKTRLGQKVQTLGESEITLGPKIHVRIWSSGRSTNAREWIMKLKHKF